MAASSKSEQAEPAGEYDDLIERLNIPMNTNENPHSDLAPVILIRHGLSMMNIKFMEAGFDYETESPEKLKLESDPSLIDAELHPIGIQQCENH
jgi:hypothetical protein